jgi:hypothetical protein
MLMVITTSTSALLESAGEVIDGVAKAVPDQIKTGRTRKFNGTPLIALAW